MPPALREAVGGTAGTLRGGLGVAAALGVLLAVRLPYLTDPPSPDEAGFLIVARQWGLGDDTTYGDYWVDRPPLLLLLFKLAHVAGGLTALRVLGLLAAAALVLLAAAVGRAVATPAAGGWCALAAAALSSSYVTGGHLVDGELLAAPFVLACCWAVLSAVLAKDASRGTLAVRGLLAGTTGTAAVLVKQNVLEGLVFSAVLLVLAALARRPGRDSRADVAATAAGVLVGVAAVAGTVALWAISAGPGLGELGYAMYGFRVEAAATIAESSSTRPMSRLVVLILAAVASGLVPLLVMALRDAAAPVMQAEPLSSAFAAMLLVGVVGVAVGASYWRHYLVALVPVTVVGIALVAHRRPHSRWLPGLVGLTVVSSLVATVTETVVHREMVGVHAEAAAVGKWLREHGSPGDTAVVTYGHVNALHATGMDCPYPYLWSLPVRVRDPELELLAATLDGPAAPTWLVEWEDVDTWGLDSAGRVREVLADEYETVAELGGVTIHRRR